MMRDTVEAVVRAGGVDTTYVRAGQGRPVLLMVHGTPATIARGALFRRLAEDFRVLAPAPIPEAVTGRGSGGAVPVRIWLRGLLEGLGLHRPSLVADVAFSALLEPFLESEGGGLARMVFIVPGAGDGALDELVAHLGRATGGLDDP